MRYFAFTLLTATTAACWLPPTPPPVPTEPTEPVEMPPADCQFDNWNVTEDRRLTKSCSPYEIDRSIEVRGGATLSIDPGVELRFGADEWLEIAGSGEGKLVAVGTSTAPIVFTSKTPATGAKGQWYGVVFRAGTLEGSAA